ncbi:hypothetical protein [Dyadobacter frigoris]|uniref:hypothetical protein n=1 Tax=Dyadobacter frigoris TaxID=2576211 RepID=UPI00255710DF|nr:hypothetical protein [Dyadobacter frigoris]
MGVNVLLYFGWEIESSKVSVFESILPAAYLFLFLFSIKYIRSNKKELYVKKTEEFKLLVLIILLVIFQKYMGQTGFFSTIMNCLILPVMVSIIMPLTSSKSYSPSILNLTFNLKKILFAFFLVECFWAILERVTLKNIFPFADGGNLEKLAFQVETAEFRSTALVNHPLQNALCVSIIMSFILISSLKPKQKYLLWSLGFASILSFNTRSSIFGWGILFLLYLAHSLFLNKYKSVREKANLFYFTIGGAIIVVLLMFSLNWGQRIAKMGLFDESSSKARIQILNVFNYYSWDQFLWGLSAAETRSMVDKVEVAIIENFWLIYLFRYGLIFTILLAIFFYKLFARLLLGYSFFQRLFVVSCFLLISSTNNSLAVASPAMALFIICCYLFNPNLEQINIKKIS